MKTAGPVPVAHAFNPSTLEAEAGGSSVGSRPAWSTEQVPGQSGIHIEEPCLEKQNNKNADIIFRKTSWATVSANIHERKTILPTVGHHFRDT